MTGISRLAIVLFCLTPASVWADRVVLTDGKVLEGEIVSQTDSNVKIKIQSGGTITYTKTIPADRVKLVEKSIGDDQTKGEETSPDSDSSSSQATTPKSLLNEATQAWREKDFRTASISTTRLIRGASLSELDALNAESLAEIDMDIARLAASSRIASAIDGNKGTNINLTSVTDFEARTLVQMLDQAIEEALEFDPVQHEDDGGYLAILLEQVQDVKWALQAEGNSPPDESDPAPGGKAGETKSIASGSGKSTNQVLAQLLKRPDGYQADPKAAKSMLRHVRTTASLVHQKSKHDRSLRKDREAKKETAQLRIALGEVSKEVQRAVSGRSSASRDLDADRLQAQRQTRARQQAGRDRQAKEEKRKRDEGAADGFKPGGTSRSRRGGGRVR